VFGNSNSLPISLVMSLSNTVSGLHWDQLPGDSDAEVAARGILYLLIFQQLGQLVRWSWGYHVLLAPPKDENTEPDIEAPPQDPFVTPHFENSLEGFFPPHPTENEPLLGQRNHHRHYTGSTDDSAFESGPSGERTPVSNRNPTRPSTPPSPSRRQLVSRICSGFLKGVWEFMNPPLWAMLVALIVASIPRLQHVFFTPGTFVNNSVTRAVSQSGGVAVPLILVVLGANLANSTSGATTPHETKHENKLLFASLVSRMVLPMVFCAPALALAAKYVSISILDDPIFVVVCFLLVGAPSALQLAQICQINQVYESVITRVLFWGYVIVVLPSTLVLVVAALEVVEWAM
jgi:predicted permease